MILSPSLDSTTAYWSRIVKIVVLNVPDLIFCNVWLLMLAIFEWWPIFGFLVPMYFWSWNFVYNLVFQLVVGMIYKIEATLNSKLAKLSPLWNAQSSHWHLLFFQALKVHRWRPNSTLNDPSHLCNITSLSACWRPKLWPPLFIMRQNGVKKV